MDTLLSLALRKYTTKSAPFVYLFLSSWIHSLWSPQITEQPDSSHASIYVFIHSNFTHAFFLTQMMGHTRWPKMSANFNKPTQYTSLGSDSNDHSYRPRAEVKNSTVDSSTGIFAILTTVLYPAQSTLHKLGS